MSGYSLVCAICNLEASTKGCVCDGNILLLGNNCLREHIADLTMDHNLVDLDLALRMQENPSLIDPYLTLQSKTQEHKSHIEIEHLTQEKFNEYGVYKVLQLLNIPISCDQYYSTIDITEITVLNLNKKNIDDWEAKRLALLELNALQALDLSNSSIGDEGARALSQGNFTSLTTLNLEGNKIGYKGTKSLSQGNLTGLTTLNLSWNMIGYKAVRALSEGNLTSLNTLILLRNGLGDEGARALSQGNLTSLTTLNLETIR
jgi:hypothetical protein